MTWYGFTKISRNKSTASRSGHSQKSKDLLEKVVEVDKSEAEH